MTDRPISPGEKLSLPIAGNLAMCHIVHMDRDQIIAKLREHAPELKAAGVVHLFLHGSYARGTAIRASSDVDVIAEFDPRRRLSLVDMVAIENRLTELLGVRVDLSPEKTLKEPVRNKAKREAVLAF
jgi:predicted nucleotidyltransferase